ncbi:MAG: Processive diacylglycerol beta-glucosyltransferase [Pelotomaculum sp. PtaB.Bin104]|nr:MAG: Processive diacylglycerol beta-glucosyltransferase [Pelotomaculum sp. PtaB.Bin104]
MVNKILILSVTVGTGHMRTAQALQKAAGDLCPGLEVTILDTFRYASPFVEKFVLGTYMQMLKISPAVYGFLYRQAERGQPLSGRGKFEFNRVMNMLAAPRLVKYIQSYQPDVIVCTHPFPLGIISFMKNKGLFTGPVFATITDFTIHSFWVFPEVDYYLVGAEQLIEQCEEFGLCREQVHFTGIPIDPAFSLPVNKKEQRARLGLEPDLPAVLITGGGLGMGGLEEAVLALGGPAANCQLMVVTGTNTLLKDRLEKNLQAFSSRVKVFGYVDNIHELMAAADLMVGKAGGLSCAEAMAAGLPVFVLDPLPGQEERNAEFLVSMEAGVRVKEQELADQVRAYLAQSSRFQAMARAAAALGRPRAAFDAVNIMVNDREASQVKCSES